MIGQLLDFEPPTKEALEEPARAGSKLCSIAILSILFMMKARSEIRSTPAKGLVIWCATGPAAGILLSAAVCANVCVPANNIPANNRKGTSNRI